MELLTPGTGLIVWQAIIFLLLFFLLAKLAWKPIVQSLRIREESIQDALDSAEKAKEEMAKLKADNEKLLNEAREERDQILKDARTVAAKLRAEAEEDANAKTSKMIEDAKQAIETEKKAAIAELKSQVANLSIDIAEKVVREELSNKDKQIKLVESMLGEATLN